MTLPSWDIRRNAFMRDLDVLEVPLDGSYTPRGFEKDEEGLVNWIGVLEKLHPKDIPSEARGAIDISVKRLIDERLRLESGNLKNIFDAGRYKALIDVRLSQMAGLYPTVSNTIFNFYAKFFPKNTLASAPTPISDPAELFKAINAAGRQQFSKEDLDIILGIKFEESAYQMYIEAGQTRDIQINLSFDGYSSIDLPQAELLLNFYRATHPGARMAEDFSNESLLKLRDDFSESRMWQRSQSLTNESLIDGDDFSQFDNRTFWQSSGYQIRGIEQMVGFGHSAWNMRRDSGDDNVWMSSIEFIRGNNDGGALLESGEVRERKGNQDDVTLAKAGHTLYRQGYPRNQTTFWLPSEKLNPPAETSEDEEDPSASAFVSRYLPLQWLVRSAQWEYYSLPFSFPSEREDNTGFPYLSNALLTISAAHPVRNFENPSDKISNGARMAESKGLGNDDFVLKTITDLLQSGKYNTQTIEQPEVYYSLRLKIEALLAGKPLPQDLPKDSPFQHEVLTEWSSELKDHIVVRRPPQSAARGARMAFDAKIEKAIDHYIQARGLALSIRRFPKQMVEKRVRKKFEKVVVSPLHKNIKTLTHIQRMLDLAAYDTPALFPAEVSSGLETVIGESRAVVAAVDLILPRFYVISQSPGGVEYLEDKKGEFLKHFRDAAAALEGARYFIRTGGDVPDFDSGARMAEEASFFKPPFDLNEVYKKLDQYEAWSPQLTAMPGGYLRALPMVAVVGNSQSADQTFTVKGLRSVLENAPPKVYRLFDDKRSRLFGEISENKAYIISALLKEQYIVKTGQVSKKGGAIYKVTSKGLKFAQQAVDYILTSGARMADQNQIFELVFEAGKQLLEAKNLVDNDEENRHFLAKYVAYVPDTPIFGSEEMPEFLDKYIGANINKLRELINQKVQKADDSDTVTIESGNQGDTLHFPGLFAAGLFISKVGRAVSLLEEAQKLYRLPESGDATGSSGARMAEEVLKSEDRELSRVGAQRPTFASSLSKRLWMAGIATRTASLMVVKSLFTDFMSSFKTLASSVRELTPSAIAEMSFLNDSIRVATSLFVNDLSFFSGFGISFSLKVVREIVSNSQEHFNLHVTSTPIGSAARMATATSSPSSKFEVRSSKKNDLSFQLPTSNIQLIQGAQIAENFKITTAFFVAGGLVGALAAIYFVIARRSPQRPTKQSMSTKIASVASLPRNDKLPTSTILVGVTSEGARRALAEAIGKRRDVQIFQIQSADPERQMQELEEKASQLGIEKPILMDGRVNFEAKQKFLRRLKEMNMEVQELFQLFLSNRKKFDKQYQTLTSDRKAEFYDELVALLPRIAPKEIAEGMEREWTEEEAFKMFKLEHFHPTYGLGFSDKVGAIGQAPKAAIWTGAVLTKSLFLDTLDDRDRELAGHNMQIVDHLILTQKEFTELRDNLSEEGYKQFEQRFAENRIHIVEDEAAAQALYQALNKEYGHENILFVDSRENNLLRKAFGGEERSKLLLLEGDYTLTLDKVVAEILAANGEWKHLFVKGLGQDKDGFLIFAPVKPIDYDQQLGEFSLKLRETSKAA